MAVADFVMRLIAHDKADRPADAAAVVDAIAALERGLRPPEQGGQKRLREELDG